MMIVVANLRLAGFFRLVNAWVVMRARHPFALLTVRLDFWSYFKIGAPLTVVTIVLGAWWLWFALI